MDPERPGRCNVSVDEKQHDTITAAEGQQLAKLTINFLKSIRKMKCLELSQSCFATPK